MIIPSPGEEVWECHELLCNPHQWDFLLWDLKQCLQASEGDWEVQLAGHQGDPGGSFQDPVRPPTRRRGKRFFFWKQQSEDLPRRVQGAPCVWHGGDLSRASHLVLHEQLSKWRQLRDSSQDCEDRRSQWRFPDVLQESKKVRFYLSRINPIPQTTAVAELRRFPTYTKQQVCCVHMQCRYNTLFLPFSHIPHIQVHQGELGLWKIAKASVFASVRYKIKNKK